MLGAIVIAYVSLTDAILDEMLGLRGPRSSRFILKKLLCLLSWNDGGPIRMLHASFADYMSDPRRSRDQPWFIDIQLHHHKFAIACFDSMNMDLRFNICALETSYSQNKDISDLQSKIEQNIHGPLSYACQFWANHLQHIAFDNDICDRAQNFLHTQILYWLEVLSLLGEVRIAPQALSLLIDWVNVSCILS